MTESLTERLARLQGKGTGKSNIRTDAFFHKIKKPTTQEELVNFLNSNISIQRVKK